MKPQSDIDFLEEAHLLIYRPRGLLNEEAVNRIIHVIDQLEASWKEPFNRFLDGLGIEEVELNFRYMIKVSLYRRRVYAERPPVKSAILATDSTMLHYARLHALLTQGSPITACVFQERRQVADWLGVPIELLEPGK